MKKLFVLAALLMAISVRPCRQFDFLPDRGTQDPRPRAEELQLAVLHPDLGAQPLQLQPRQFQGLQVEGLQRRCRHCRAGADGRACPGSRRSGHRTAAGGARRKLRASGKSRACRADNGGDLLARAVSRSRSTTRPDSGPDHRTAARPGRRRARACAGHAARHLGHRAKQGQRPDPGMRTEPVRLCREDRQEILINMKPQASKWTRTNSRSRQRPQLQLDDRDEGHQRAAGSGLRLWRHVLRRPDLEARQLK